MSKNYYDCVVGIGYASRNNYRDEPLANMPCASAGIIYRDSKQGKETMLKSYETFVLKKDAAGYVQCTGIYSRTTIKHISAWLKQFAPKISYYAIKEAYKNGYAIHAENGNIVKLDPHKVDIYGFMEKEAE